MDETTINLLTDMGIKLSTLAVKGTTTAIHSKLESIRNEKEIAKITSTYEEIINQLLSERAEAILIAQIYKEQVDKVVISDEDIDHLHNTVKRVLQILKVVTPNNSNIDSFNDFTELINVDTLKAMQLLGFNYKAAIGEPLTDLCANSIRSIGSKGKGSALQQRKNK